MTGRTCGRPLALSALIMDRRIPISAAALLWALTAVYAAADPGVKPLFSVRQSPERWWLTSPEGQPFFSVGVCVLDQGTARHAYNDARPAYGAWRHYESPDKWADACLRRLKDWKFTTIGGWSDVATLGAS